MSCSGSTPDPTVVFANEPQWMELVPAGYFGSTVPLILVVEKDGFRLLRQSDLSMHLFVLEYGDHSTGTVAGAPGSGPGVAQRVILAGGTEISIHFDKTLNAFTGGALAFIASTVSAYSGVPGPDGYVSTNFGTGAVVPVDLTGSGVTPVWFPTSVFPGAVGNPLFTWSAGIASERIVVTEGTATEPGGLFVVQADGTFPIKVGDVGLAPRGLVFDGVIGFVPNSESDTVTVFRRDPTTGVFTMGLTVSVGASPHCGDIRTLSNGNREIVIPCRAGDSISVIEVDPSDMSIVSNVNRLLPTGQRGPSCARFVPGANGDAFLALFGATSIGDGSGFTFWFR